MNKKILSVLFLLIFFASITVAYYALNQPATQDNQPDGSSEDITQDDLEEEINNSFLNENEEIDIGDMV